MASNRSESAPRIADAHDTGGASRQSSHETTASETCSPPRQKVRDIIIGAPHGLDDEERAWLGKGKELLEKGIALMRAEKHEESGEFIRSALPFLEAANELEPLAQAYHYVGLLAHFADRPVEGIEPMEKAVDFRRYLDNPRPLVTSLACLTVLYRNANRIPLAIKTAEETIERARNTRAEALLVLGLVALGRALMVEGEYRDTDRAVGAYEEAVEVMRAFGKPVPTMDLDELEFETNLARCGLSRG